MLLYHPPSQEILYSRCMAIALVWAWQPLEDKVLDPTYLTATPLLKDQFQTFWAQIHKFAKVGRMHPHKIGPLGKFCRIHHGLLMGLGPPTTRAPEVFISFFWGGL